MAEVVNPFVGPSVAARYSRSRPALHETVVEILRGQIGRASRALDLGCGTGLSTRPLAAAAGFVVGADASLDMLTEAEQAGGATLAAAAAERLPFRDGVFDLATIASAIHWFDPPALQELTRVMAAGGVLAVYDVWFPGEMIHVPAFSGWVGDVCNARYPQVPKQDSMLESLPSFGFELCLEQETRHPVVLVITELADYLMTHSNRIAAVKAGSETESQQMAFFVEQLRPFFSGGETRTVLFGIWLKIYRKNMPFGHHEG